MTNLEDQSPADRGKAEWLQARRSFIGGSDVYQLLNEKQYGRGCVRALAYDKLDTPPDFPNQLDAADLAILERGNILEPIVADLYQEQTGRKLRRPPLDRWGLPKPRMHPEYPWAGVHADRIVLVGSGGVEETGTAEIKTRDRGPFLQLLRSGLFNGDNLQIQHGMWVNAHRWGTFATLGVFGGLPLKYFDVKRDEGVIEIIKREGDRFAETVFGKRGLPDRPFSGDDERCKVCAWRMECRGEELDLALAEQMKAEKAGKIPLVQIESAELAQALADAELLKAEIADREQTLELVKNTIRDKLDGIDAAFVDGFGKVYNRMQAGRTTAELGKLMQYVRDLAAQAAPIIETCEKEKYFTDSVRTGVPDAAFNAALMVLKSIVDAPEVISKKFCKTGDSHRVLRSYPVEVRR